MSRTREPRGRAHALLAEAHRARNRGRERRAINLYRRILLEEPQNAEVALRLAPMLARRGETFEAWQLYRQAARALALARRYETALRVYQEACRFLPFEFEAWRLCAELQLKLGREDAAYETLIDGRMHFRDVGTRAQAIALLSRARVIEPWEPYLVLDLARLHARSGQADVAVELLSCLASRERGVVLQKVRAQQWRITLSPRFAWLWLRAIFAPAAGPSPSARYETIRD